MNKKQLVSVRLDRENLEWFNELSKKGTYANRSFIINHFLSALRTCAAKEDAESLLAAYDPFSQGCHINISFNK